jgi:membrane carboxypeptidase/penicillin-binding protein PbpC
MHVVEALAALPRPPQRDLVQRWQALAKKSRTHDTLLAVMREFLDPAYATHTALERIAGQALYLPSLRPECLDANLAAKLIR